MTQAPPILCIVGPSESGKTTLMEGLIRELSKRDYRVATIKHTRHVVELDQPGKDSWRHRQAGAVVSIISSSGLVAVFGEAKQELTVEELRSRFVQSASGGVDLILAEGYKSSGYPKVVVVGNEGWDAAQWTGVKAVVSNQRLELDIPVFQPSDVTGIVTFLEYEFLGHLSGLSS